jgi:hypothetical protein
MMKKLVDERKDQLLNAKEMSKLYIIFSDQHEKYSNQSSKYYFFENKVRNLYLKPQASILLLTQKNLLLS